MQKQLRSCSEHVFLSYYGCVCVGVFPKLCFRMASGQHVAAAQPRRTWRARLGQIAVAYERCPYRLAGLNCVKGHQISTIPALMGTRSMYGARRNERSLRLYFVCCHSLRRTTENSCRPGGEVDQGLLCWKGSEKGTPGQVIRKSIVLLVANAIDGIGTGGTLDVHRCRPNSDECDNAMAELEKVGVAFHQSGERAR